MKLPRFSKESARLVDGYQPSAMKPVLPTSSHLSIAPAGSPRSGFPRAGLIALLLAGALLLGGEFGRTPMMQGALKPDQIGRDHHPHGYTIWIAGGGIKPGMVYGKSDEFGFYARENKVHVHDLNATILHLFGLEHTKLTYHFQGRDFRLTDVHGEVVRAILA